MIPDDLIILGTWIKVVEGSDIAECAKRLMQFGERFKTQKKVYLLQAAGANLGYTFHWDLHGPYSAELGESIGFIADPAYQQEIADRIASSDLSESGYRKLERARELWRLPAALPGAREESWLEALASIHFLHHLGASGSEPEKLEDEVVKKKPHLPRDLVRAARGRLAELHLLEPSPHAAVGA